MHSIQKIENIINNEFKFLAVTFGILCTKIGKFFFMFVWLNSHFIIFFVFCAIPQKNFPSKNWERCNFLFPHYYNLHIFCVENMCLCNFPKLFYCVEGFFEAWNLFLNVFYLQSFGILEIIIDNIRRNLKNMQFGKIAAAGYKCNLRVANKELGFSVNVL